MAREWWLNPELFGQDDVVSAYDDLCLWAAPFGLSLLERVKLVGVEKGLDIGCGTGFPLIELAERLGPNAQMVGLDPWQAGLRRTDAKIKTRGVSNVQTVLAKAESIPFGDCSFDIVVSNNGLNNVASVNDSLRECYRVLKGGGQMVMTANLPESMRLFYDVFESVLADFGLGQCIEKMNSHIEAKRKPSAYWVKELSSVGFADIRPIEHCFVMRFANGTALFSHWFIRAAFVQSWANVVAEEDINRVLTEIETRLNAAREEVRLMIPFVCIEATKPRVGR